MTMLGEMMIEDAAREVAGNWQRFTCFVWDRDRDLDNSDNWAIIYTPNRDSRRLDLSNADAIAEALEPYTEGDDPDVVMETHSHWAIGHVDGFSIQVYWGGEITGPPARKRARRLQVAVERVRTLRPCSTRCRI